MFQKILHTSQFLPLSQLLSVIGHLWCALACGCLSVCCLHLTHLFVSVCLSLPFVILLRTQAINIRAHPHSGCPHLVSQRILILGSKTSKVFDHSEALSRYFLVRKPLFNLLHFYQKSQQNPSEIRTRTTQKGFF